MNVLTSPCTKALTVLKSELVTEVVFNNASIWSGPTAICRGIDGSTEPRSRSFLAWINFATVMSALPLAIWFAASIDVLVPPALPVRAVPVAAAMMLSSIARPIAAAAADLFTLSR